VAKMAVIVTYDENGGYWDHAPPPAGPGWSDRWGPARASRRSSCRRSRSAASSTSRSTTPPRC